MSNLDVALYRIQEAITTKSNSLDLSHCNLQTLPLEITKIKDLEILTLNSNRQLDNLDLIANLQNLREISFSDTPVKDIKPLSSCSKLTKIQASSTRIRNLNPLLNLKHIHDLNIGSTLIKDITVVSQLKGLTDLHIYDTAIRDLTPLKTLSNLIFFNCHTSKITDLSPLSKLKTLEAIRISDSAIEDLTPLAQLKKLKILNAFNTQINDLYPISNLENLKILFIGDSLVKDLFPISNLHQLEELDISNTKIDNIKSIKNLNSIKKIYMKNTNVSDTRSLEKLNNLIMLDISNNPIENLYNLRNMITRGITIKTKEASNILKDEQGIFIKNCPIKNPPYEIIEQGNEAILRYWEQIEQQQGTVELFEAKLIIVGEGGTGKTTLFEKLKDADHKVGNTPETHGINIHEGLPFQHKSIGENTFHANLWDFGGQDLQYMTHQFFLTPRALYVLMMDARRESPNLAYWFKVISLLGRESEDSKEKVKLLMVFNKRANSTGLPQYHDILKFYEDTIDAQFLEVDFAINDYRFDNLCNSIQNHLIGLPIVKSQLPRLWKNVREDLRNEAQNENYISIRRFAEICSKYQIEKEEDQWLLSGYMHQLGSLLHFQNDKGLRSWVILKPQWAVDGVYSFLTDENIVSNYGHFKETEFMHLLAAKGFNREGADLILQLMTKNNFDICYEASPGRYVAAQLLPDVAPEYPWYPPREMLQFRYQYSIMPKGLMSRLIVRLSDDLEVNQETGKQTVWKRGGVFRIKSREGECRVRLREDDAESKSGVRQILIEVSGEENARKLALHKIRNEIDDLHRKWFRGIKPDEFIPCRCSKCFGKDDPELYKLEKLLMKSTVRKDTSCDSSGEDILIQTLLEGIYDQQEIYNMKRER